ncbi:SDR family NAD(P)-dependent oxidoreductase [Halococcus thailandensis]|uniref:Short chain dehydrogenase/reductase oxidoreductase n=1 Tax=Halococcus thailandensis JCM 13552 TaxID=1227457 RepID=M0NBS0_9EURY|nr:glucose 1-dehydrogenase [Halococcus thailandensis]EMA54120.1 short chain dehydrogenase/reductase oxidoreductase [Halococcus thailandensis JCM 13552]
MNGLNDKTVAVTGAGAGIGRASALRFAEEGANVIVTDIDEDAGRETVELIEDDGGEALFLTVDITSQSDITAMVEEAVDSYGGLDVAHNNAAGAAGEMVPTAEVSEDDWDKELDITLKSTWRCMRHEIDAMLEQGGGAIVNTSSGAGLKGQRNVAPYSAGKHGVVGLTRTAALEYAEDGIRINAVCPGPVDTPGYSQMPDEMREKLKSNVPMRRLGDPEEMANAAVWLCSDDASYVTGMPLSVDGGIMAGR